MNIKRKVYLAGPFFNDHQVEVIRKLEGIVDNHPMLTEVFSPSRDGVKLVIHESTFEERKQVFLANCYNIDDASVVVAFTNNNDQGTYWEIGRALELDIPVIQVVSDDTPEIEGVSGYLRLDDPQFESALSLQVLNLSTRRRLAVVVVPDKTTQESLDELYSELMDLRSEFGKGSLYLDVMTISEYLDNLDETSTASVVAMSIDDRDPLISMELGRLYATSKKNRVLTFSRQQFGVNVMLQHSIVSHSIEMSGLMKEIERLVNYDYEVDESHYRSTKEFE